MYGPTGCRVRAGEYLLWELMSRGHQVHHVITVPTGGYTCSVTERSAWWPQQLMMRGYNRQARYCTRPLGIVKSWLLLLDDFALID